MEHQFKKVFMSGDIISDPIIRELDFLRSQPQARVLVITRTNPEVFSQMTTRLELEEEAKVLNKKLKTIMGDDLFKLNDEDRKKQSDEREMLLLEIEDVSTQLQFIEGTVTAIVEMDKTHKQCEWDYVDHIDKNFVSIFKKLADEKSEIKDYDKIEIKVEFVEEYFSK